MSLVSSGALLGLMGGGGASLAVSRLPLLRRPTLQDRVDPYLRDTTRPSRLLVESRARTAFPTLERLVSPIVADAVRGGSYPPLFIDPIDFQALYLQRLAAAGGQIQQQTA